MFPDTPIPDVPRGLPVILDGLVVVSDRLMHASARDADVARLQLTGAVRQLRAVDPSAGPRAVQVHLDLVSLTLDRLSAHVKTACEVALGGGADLDHSRAHSILATMRENLHHDAKDLVLGGGKPGEFYPELEVSADRLVRVMREQVASLAPENDEAVLAVRERTH